MARDYQSRLVLKGLARVGQPSLLDGLPCGFAHVERDADLANGGFETVYDNHMVRVNIVTLARSFNPRSDQVVVIENEGSFRLDRLLKDTGITIKFVGIEV